MFFFIIIISFSSYIQLPIKELLFIYLFFILFLFIYLFFILFIYLFIHHVFSSFILL